MGDQEVLAVATRINEAWNASDWGAYSAYLTNDTVFEAPISRVRGPEAILQSTKGFKEAFPDMKKTVTNALACGNTAVLEITGEGTHTGPLQTPSGMIPPTHRRVTIKAAQLSEISDGKWLAVNISMSQG